MRMNVAIASSLEYIVYSKVLLMSLFENNMKHQFTVYYAYMDDAMKSAIEKLNEYARTLGNEVVPIRISDNYISENINVRVWSHITYARHALYNMLPENIDRILCIGLNLLIKSDISQLYNIDLQGKTIAGTDFVKYPEEFSNKKLLNITQNRMKKMDLKLELSQWIVPSVLIIDIKKWRSKFFYEEYIKLIEHYPLQCLDEEALNILFEGDKLPIQNYIYSTAIAVPEDILEKTIKDAKIIHYPGQSKPWITYGVSEISDMWWEYAKRSGLYEEYIKRGTELMWNYNKEMHRYSSTKYKALERFVSLKEEDGDFLYRILKKRNINNIVLYGNGTMKEHIVHELRNTDISILCTVDAIDCESEDSIFIHKFMDNIEKYKKSDIMLLTSAPHVDEMKSYFENKIAFPVVGINELLEI